MAIKSTITLRIMVQVHRNINLHTATKIHKYNNTPKATVTRRIQGGCADP